jgi:hypothetical protein
MIKKYLFEKPWTSTFLSLSSIICFCFYMFRCSSTGDFCVFQDVFFYSFFAFLILSCISGFWQIYSKKGSGEKGGAILAANLAIFLSSIFIIPILIMVMPKGSVTALSEKPDKNLGKEYLTDFSKIEYQYGQKFGFHETCDHIRIFGKPKNRVQLKNRLPISEKDLKSINGFLNKVDEFKVGIFSPVYEYSDAFSHMRISQFEYKSGANLKMNTKKGTYEIYESKLKSTFKIYDAETNRLYIETHFCDGF